VPTLNIIVEVAEEWLVYLAILYLVVIGMTRAKKKSCESRLRTAFDHHCLGRDVSQIQTKFQSNPIGYQYCYPIWLSRAEQKRKRKEKKKEKGIVRLSE